MVVAWVASGAATMNGGAMTDSIKTRGRVARWASGAGLLAAGVIAGGALAGTLGADAATTPNSGGSSSSSSIDVTQSTRDSYPAHGTAAHEALEKAVTGTNASKAQAAAVRAVSGGTAGAVTTDVSGNGYEVTVTKSDGSQVEVPARYTRNPGTRGRTQGARNDTIPARNAMR